MVGIAARSRAARDRSMAGLVDEFKGAWDDYVADARKMMAAIAAGNIRRYSAQTGISSGGRATQVLKMLENIGDIVKDEDGVSGYRVVDPLYAHWIRAGRPSY